MLAVCEGRREVGNVCVCVWMEGNSVHMQGRRMCMHKKEMMSMHKALGMLRMLTTTVGHKWYHGMISLMYKWSLTAELTDGGLC